MRKQSLEEKETGAEPLKKDASQKELVEKEQSEKELKIKEFIIRENELIHAPYGPEVEFYHAVKRGDIRKVRELCKERFSEKPGFGMLSDHVLQNFKYHLVVTVAMVARTCIEAGMPHTQAYTISDIYIQQTDRCSSIEEIDRLHDKMALDYAKKMGILHKSTICSKPVVDCINYIYEHLHTRITMEKLSGYVNLNASYLSKLFKKEMKITINRYIMLQKIETAKNMLRYSDYTVAQIASLLAFPSQSYFTEVFRKNVGDTPTRYRNTYYSVSV